MSDSATIRANVDSFLSNIGASLSFTYVGETIRDNDWKCDEWRFCMARKDKQTMIDSYFTGLGHREKTALGKLPHTFRKGTLAYEAWEKTALKPKAPTAADVLRSLILDASAIDESFSDWCDNFGYDSDSIKALNTYNACCEIGKKLRKFFTRAEMETLREMMQDY